MTVNVPLLRQTMKHIEDNPHEWDQRDWRYRTPCGTRACFAGWAAAFAGAQFDEENPSAVVVGEELVHVSEYAMEALGLSEKQADDLFYGNNDMADLKRRVGELIAGEE